MQRIPQALRQLFRRSSRQYFYWAFPSEVPNRQRCSREQTAPCVVSRVVHTGAFPQEITAVQVEVNLADGSPAQVSYEFD